MRRFKNKASAVLALTPAALEVIERIAGPGKFLFRQLSGPVSNGCPHCGCTSSFVHLREGWTPMAQGPAWRSLECPRCHAVTNYGDLTNVREWL